MTILNRLRSAESGSRDLDYRIAHAVDLDLPECGLTVRGYVALHSDDFGDAVIAGEKYHSAIRSLVPPYTTSIDAALALVERMLPGCSWNLHWRGLGKNCDGWLERPTEDGQDFTHRYEWAGFECPSPALAILIALFSALETEDTTP